MTRHRGRWLPTYERLARSGASTAGSTRKHQTHIYQQVNKAACSAYRLGLTQPEFEAVMLAGWSKLGRQIRAGRHPSRPRTPEEVSYYLNRAWIGAVKYIDANPLKDRDDLRTVPTDTAPRAPTRRDDWVGGRPASRL